MNQNDVIQKSLETIYTEERHPMHDEITANQWAEFSKLSGAVSGQSILDVGCGSGVGIQHFLDLGLRVTALSPNQEEIKTVWNQFNGQIDVIYGALEHKPDTTDNLGTVGPYDLIWARHVLEHCTNPLLSLTIIKDLLKECGWVYMEFPSPDTECNHEFNPNHFSVLGKRMWQSLIHKAGLVEKFYGHIDLETMAGPDKYIWFIARKGNG